MRPRITHLTMMGDSLSDRGMMDHRKLCGCIPMSRLSGLQQRSPLGRFTNGFVWTDHLSAMLANQYLINRFKSQGDSPSDIADDIIMHNTREESVIERSYNLDNYRVVKYKGHVFIRSYDEGGLTAYSYKWMPSKSISRFFSRLILPCLQTMRDKILARDIQNGASAEQKAETLVVEWSGANDLLTVNEKPSEIEVMRAVAARISNAKILIANGYQHFVLIDLPDFSLTPRYHLKTDRERQAAQGFCELFNNELRKQCQQLQNDNPNCTIEVFDINSQFGDIYQHPEKYHLDPAKLTQPYTLSSDFTNPPDHLSPAPGYMFWDDIHPTSHVHALLADRFYTTYLKKFEFAPPEAYVQQPVVANSHRTSSTMT